MEPSYSGHHWDQNKLSWLQRLSLFQGWIYITKYSVGQCLCGLNTYFGKLGFHCSLMFYFSHCFVYCMHNVTYSIIMSYCSYRVYFRIKLEAKCLNPVSFVDMTVRHLRWVYTDTILFGKCAFIVWGFIVSIQCKLNDTKLPCIMF